VKVDPSIDVMVIIICTIPAQLTINEHSPFGIVVHPFELPEPSMFVGQLGLLLASPVRDVNMIVLVAPSQ
jgi:hypothetical protein